MSAYNRGDWVFWRGLRAIVCGFNPAGAAIICIAGEGVDDRIKTAADGELIYGGGSW